MSIPIVPSPAIVQPADPITTEAPPAATPNPDPHAALKAELDQTRRTLATLTRDRQIARELFAHGALDLDIAGAVVERDLSAKPESEIPALIADLKRRKPTLFRRPATPEPAPASRSSTMAPRPAPAESPRDRAARTAGASNSRTALLTYLRLRRQPAD